MKTHRSSERRSVILFGTFDPLHDGHINFIRQAEALGDVTVVVARDSSVRYRKDRNPSISEQDRLSAVNQLEEVDVAVLGDEYPMQYDILRRMSFDIVALGYDQEPSDDVVRLELDALGKQDVDIVRLDAYLSETYKSSFLREND